MTATGARLVRTAIPPTSRSSFACRIPPVLTADLVNARRRKGELQLVALDGPRIERARIIAGQLLEAVGAHVGRTREEVDEAIGAIEVGPREHRLKDGLTKLVLDRATFDADESEDPATLRASVFARAAAARALLPPGERLNRDALLEEIARERDTDTVTLERALYADLRGAHRLLEVETLSGTLLVDAYERGQAQAVLLRSVKVTVDVQCASAGATRALFRRLKFLRLLHTITKTEAGHRIVIDGPFSLFDAVTKYGLQLALVLPALDGCDAWTLEADVRWGKAREPLTFKTSGGPGPGAKVKGKRSTPEPPLPDEVRALVTAFTKLDGEWRVTPANTILETPGIGMCVPDLVFERARDGVLDRVYLEVMGFWSRDAVWKRVELVQAGLCEAIVFAVSSRLRVSEAVLGDELPAALYVYKGTMNARSIAERLDLVARRLPGKFHP